MHTPVLYNEVLQYLNPRPGENFIDCTLGDGGHTLGILERNAPDGKILGIDWDMEMIKRVIVRLSNEDLRDRFFLAQDNFSNLENIVDHHKFKNVAGVLLDLGMGSYHIENSKRGFSFRGDEELDMRYNKNSQLLTAEKIINMYSEGDLERIFREYGEERFARQVARKIIEVRGARPIRVTGELVNVIKLAVPIKYRFGRIHFATKIFQALRIAVNQEMENLKLVLPQAFNILEKGGRLVVISFHSLEDRIVKNFFRSQSQKNGVKILTKKPVLPSAEEINNNPRARSAKMRAVVKIDA